MATNDKTKKTTTKAKSAPKKEKIEEKVEAEIDTEKEDLKKQLAEMKAQMELMSKMIITDKSQEQNNISAKKDRLIRFVNLTNGELILRGTKIWKINGMFNERSFMEREAIIILNNMKNLITSGMVYIADAKFVEDNDLGEIYQNILSDEELKNLLNKDSAYIIDAFKTVSDGQKEVIIDMIREEKSKGKAIDGNVLVTLSKISGKDLLNED